MFVFAFGTIQSMLQVQSICTEHTMCFFATGVNLLQNKMREKRENDSAYKVKLILQKYGVHSTRGNKTKTTLLYYEKTNNIPNRNYSSAPLSDDMTYCITSISIIVRGFQF